MANTQSTEQPAIGLVPLGTEGDTCANCGAALAVDQRYCLNCGERRGESRLDFAARVGANGAAVNGAPAAAANGGAPAPAAVPSSQWNPLLAIGAIGLLGVMLLLGVLIGKDDNEPTVAAAPVTTTTAAPTTPAPTDTAATPPPAATADKAAKGGGGADATAPGAGNVVEGGSGSTEGISTDNPLEGKTGKDLVEAQKNAPDVIATDGEQAALDPNGKAGGGSDATCIGC